MSYLPGFLFFVLGAVVGSFLNVVILRYGTGRGFFGRSACFSCWRKLSWFELAPIFSFLFLRGRCRHCDSRVSWQYPLVEFLAGIIFLATFWKFPDVLASGALRLALILSFLYYLAVFSLLIVIAVYDLRHKIIPDGPVYAFACTALIFLFLTHPPIEFFRSPAVFDLLAGPLAALPFFFLWFFSGGRWMGLGDAKLALGLGWFLGLTGVLFSHLDAKRLNSYRGYPH